MKIRRFWPESAKRLLAQHLGSKMITKIADEPDRALPSFWCKRRGSLRIGASQLLIAVSALRLASIQR